MEEIKNSDVRVEYIQLNDKELLILTYRPEQEEPIRTIADIVLPMKVLSKQKSTSEEKPF